VSSRLLSNNIRIKVCRNITLPVVLYGCATFSVTCREENRQGVSENMVLREIFGTELYKITGVENTTYKELYFLYYSPYIIRAIKSIRM